MAAGVYEDAFDWGDVDFVEPLPKDLECPVCLLALKKPLLTACGHRFCTACIEKISKGEKFKCPLDNTVCSRGKETFPDRDFERRVKNLKVKCNHSGKGCQWMGELTTLQDHIADGCDFEPVECPFSETGCHHKVKRRELKEHEEKNVSQHMRLLLQTVSSLKRDNEKMKRDNESLISQLGAVQMRSSSGESVSDTRRFLWRITNWSATLRDAKNHKIQKIFSDDFYSSYPGYKLCVCAIPNGKPDCRGYGHHFGASIHISKGNYDDLLEWPFKQTFKLSIVHVNPLLTITKTLNPEDFLASEPESNWHCLMRPKKERNDSGFGKLLLASHQTLETMGFTADDALLIMAEIFPPGYK